jgi:hypothetical protein
VLNHLSVEAPVGIEPPQPQRELRFAGSVIDPDGRPCKSISPGEAHGNPTLWANQMRAPARAEAAARMVGMKSVVVV